MEMSEPDNFEHGKDQGRIIAEIENLTAWVKNMDGSLKEFKMGIGSRVEVLEKDQVQMKTKMDFLMWVLARITTPILGILGVGIVGAMVWKITHG